MFSLKKNKIYINIKYKKKIIAFVQLYFTYSYQITKNIIISKI